MPNRNKTSVVQALEQLGIGENEAKLYNIMLKLGEATVLDLQKVSPFPRTLLYYILNSLMQLGLVSFIKKPRRTVYIVEDPEKLYDLLQEREKEFENNKNNLKEIIPELKNKYRLSQNRPGVRIFEGIEQYREAWEDIIHIRPDCVYSYMHITEKKKSGFEIREQMMQERSAWGIKEKILLFDTPQAREWIEQHSKYKNIECKLLTQKLGLFDADVHLYTNKVVNSVYDGREPVVLMTEDEHLFEMQKNIFTLLWKL